MKKLSLIASALFLVACGNQATQTASITQTTTETTTTQTTTKAPVLKTVGYDMENANGVSVDTDKEDVYLYITARDEKVIQAKIVAEEEVDELETMTKAQRDAAIKVVRDQLLKDPKYAVFQNLEGVTAEANFVENELVVTFIVDFEKVDVAKFEAAVGEKPLVNIFGVAAEVYDNGITLEQAENILILQGGKKLKVD